jgi:hypothetical protein
MFSKLQLYAAAGLAFVLGLVGIYWRGKSDGAEAERNEHTRRRIEAMKTAKDVRDDVEGDPDLVRRASRWVRDNDE